MNKLTHDTLLPKRVLGNTDMKLSVLGIGTVKFGRNQNLKYPKNFELPDDRTICKLLEYAQYRGINFIDTAPAYGQSEERLGKLLGKQRKQWIICTKVGENWVQSDTSPRSTYDFSPESIITSIARSRTRLGTDYLDIVLLHSNGADEDIIRMGALETLADLKQKGWLRAFGMSTKTALGGRLAAEKSDVVMLTYRPDYLEEASVLDHCARYQSGAIVKKIFASGHQVNALDNVRFALKHPATTSVLMSTINPKHLQENISALDGLVSE